MKKIALLMLLINGLSATAQKKLNIVPMPAEVKMGEGVCIVKQPVGFILIDFEDNDKGENDGEESFKKYLKTKFNITKFVDGDTHSYGLPTEILFTRIGVKKPEGYYELEVTGTKIYIKGTALGKFYAFETLKQMMTVNARKEIVIPNCKITDYPRFKYRGMHLDVGRHFMPVSFIKKYIDYLAAYKFNTFHWHLTEDQGWRIEIKKYPLLTSVGGYRNGTIIGGYPGKGNDSLHYGGFYTQEEIKDVVKYAADRYISIIPEIEMPGHSSAAIAAYPQLSCFPDEDTKYPSECVWAGPTKGKQVQQTWGVFEDVFCPSDYTFNFLQDVLDEVMSLFPSQYIHIGGDECPKESWKRSAFCQQLMKEKGLKDEHALQSYFIQRIEKYINSKGKKIIGWDEILEGGLAPNATVMSWRGEEGGIEAAKQNHDVIMTPGDWCYFDHSQSKNEDSVTIGGYLPIEKVYSYDPVPAALTAEQAKHILGAQGNVWTEYMKTPGKVEYMIFPRMAALSEVLWTPKEKKDWKDFEKRIPGIFERLDKQKTNYSKAYYTIDASILPTPNYNGVLWKVSSKANKPIFINIDGIDSIFTYKKPVLITKSGSAVASINKTKLYAAETFAFNKATGKKITLSTPPSTQYPGDGAFTLVNGVHNVAGYSKASEFVGFEGTDCEAIIDLDKEQTISNVTVHALHLKTNWIWRPLTVEVFSSADRKIFTSLGLTDDFDKSINGKGIMSISFNSTKTRYIKVLAKNWSPIPDNEPGAGNKAWMFVDEIEVE